MVRRGPDHPLVRRFRLAAPVAGGGDPELVAFLQPRRRDHETRGTGKGRARQHRGEDFLALQGTFPNTPVRAGVVTQNDIKILAEKGKEVSKKAAHEVISIAKEAKKSDILKEAAAGAIVGALIANSQTTQLTVRGYSEGFYRASTGKMVAVIDPVKTIHWKPSHKS